LGGISPVLLGCSPADRPRFRARMTFALRTTCSPQVSLPAPSLRFTALPYLYRPISDFSAMTQQLASDIHHYDQRLTAALRNLENDKNVLEPNRKKINQFLEYKRAEGLSTPRQVRYTYVLRKLSSLLGKEFRRTTKTDMIRVMSDLEKQNTAYDTKLSEKQCIKRFYKWLRNSEDDYPVEVKWIRAKRNNNHKILPEHLLTEDEVKKLAVTCQNQRDRALILVLYETGCRVGEILTLKLGDIQFDTHGAIMILKGKTGPRRARIIFSAKALSEWLNHHPSRLDPEAPLWTSFESAGSTKPLEYYAFRKMLSVTASRGKVGKRVNPHFFSFIPPLLLSNRNNFVNNEDQLLALVCDIRLIKIE
jgi:site-specific recombinase XerD